jgi:hypothetical protein
VVGFTTGSRAEVPGKRKPVIREQQQHNNNNNNNNNNTSDDDNNNNFHHYLDFTDQTFMYTYSEKNCNNLI